MHNVIVTGASRGLGLAVSKKLALNGYRVIGVARTQTDVFRQTQAEIESAGQGELMFVRHDLMDIDAIPQLVTAMRGDSGPFFGLINNAGLGTEGILSTMPNADMENLVRLNVLAPMMLTKYVVRSMMSAKAGRIINMSSIVASTGYSGLSVYSATKAALVGFTKSLAREVGSLGITVNAIAPGFTDTDMTSGMDAKHKATIERRAALKRMTDVDDIAEAALYLMSEKARNITGTVMTIDAGSTA